VTSGPYHGFPSAAMTPNAAAIAKRTLLRNPIVRMVEPVIVRRVARIEQV
jgi:hypothetical protein